MLKQIAIAVVAVSFVVGLAVTTMAAREVVSGTVEKVDAMKGQIVLKTQAGPREFNVRTPEKLKDLKPGDKIEFTIQEDGSAVIAEKK